MILLELLHNWWPILPADFHNFCKFNLAHWTALRVYVVTEKFRCHIVYLNIGHSKFFRDLRRRLDAPDKRRRLNYVLVEAKMKIFIRGLGRCFAWTVLGKEFTRPLSLRESKLAQSWIKWVGLVVRIYFLTLVNPCSMTNKCAKMRAFFCICCG